MAVTFVVTMLLLMAYLDSGCQLGDPRTDVAPELIGA
jgi:hypothetical protein